MINSFINFVSIINNKPNKMKRLLLLFFLITTFVISNAQTYPIFGQFSLGMDEKTFSERLDTMKAHNEVKKDKYGLTLTEHEFKLGGWPFSIDGLSLSEIDNFWYGQIKEEKYNPIEFTNKDFTIDGKLVSITFWSSDDVKENMGAFSDKDLPSSRDFKHKGIYIISDVKHKALLKDMAPIKEVLTSKFGEPVVTQPAANPVTFAKGELFRSIKTPHETVNKGVGNMYDSAIPLYEWQQSNMRIVLGVRSIIGTPYITFYDSTQLNQQALDAKFGQPKEEAKELNW